MSRLLGAGRIAGDGFGVRGFGPGPGAGATPDTPIDNIPNKVECSKHFITIIFKFIDTLLLQTRILTLTSALEFRYFWRLRRPQCGESLTHRRRPNTIIPRWLRRRSRSRAFLLRNDFQWPSDMARNWISGDPVDTRPALSSDSDYCWETIGRGSSCFALRFLRRETGRESLECWEHISAGGCKSARSHSLI